MLALIGSTLLLVLWAQYDAAKLKTKRDIERHIDDLAKKLKSMPKEPNRTEFLIILDLNEKITDTTVNQWLFSKGIEPEAIFDQWKFDDGVRMIVVYREEFASGNRELKVVSANVFHENGSYFAWDARE